MFFSVNEEVFSHLFPHKTCCLQYFCSLLIAAFCSGLVSPCWSPSGTLRQSPLLAVLLLPPSCLGGEVVAPRPLSFHGSLHPSQILPIARLPGAGDFSIGMSYCRRKADKAESESSVFYIHPPWAKVLTVNLSCPPPAVGKWPLSGTTLWRPLWSW